MRTGKKHVVLFLAANPRGTSQLALDREARAIHLELKRSGYRDRFDFVTRWAAEPLDLLREIRDLRPTVVHVSGHGSAHVGARAVAGSRDVVPTAAAIETSALTFHTADGGAQKVSADAIARTIEAAGASVRLIVLNACYTAVIADVLLAHVDCVVGMTGAIHDDAARSFSIGFYGALGEQQSVAAAWKHGQAAISLEGLPDADRPQLKVRDGADAAGLILAAVTPVLRQELPCPYPGMRPYTADEAAAFHGRHREIGELIGRLRAGEREIYVIGPSGSGKSSLVTAGLLPRLARGVAGLGPFLVRDLRPGEQPAQRLAQVLEVSPGLPWTPADRIAALLAHRGPGCAVLLLVDQLEELFTLASADERRQFQDAIRDLRAEARCSVIFTLRADFYGALMESSLWKAHRGQLSRVEVGPLDEEQLREAIAAPARDAGVGIEPELVVQLLFDAAAEPGILPLLQETLVELWEVRKAQTLTLADYETLGDDQRSGLAVALARRADATVRQLTEAQAAIACRILIRLISFGEGRPDTRRQQPRAALEACGTDDVAAGPVIDRLIDARLLTSDASLCGESFVDLAHEALLAGWPQLQHWLLSRRDDEQRRRLLELHAAQWCQRGCGSVGLFDAIELAEAERWIAGDTAREVGYSDDLTRFLAASRDAIAEAERQRQLAVELQERERRAAQKERMRMRRRLVRFVMIALALIAIVASSFGLVTWWQRQEAERQRQAAEHQLARNELEQARRLVIENYDAPSAIPHLAEVVRLRIDTPALRTVLATAEKELWRIRLYHGGRVRKAAFSPDGTRVVTADADGTARVWDTVTGSPVGVPLKHEQAVRSAVFSPDGAHVVTASDDGTARVWDAATGRPVGIPLKHEDTVRSAVFSPDGARVVTASDDGTARVWDAETGNPVGVPLKHEQAVQSAVFSPDGARVVTASKDGFAQVWDTATGNPLGVPLRHRMATAISSAIFSPDGGRVVTAGDDGTARVWDAATGAPLGVPLQRKQDAENATYIPYGQRVVSAAFSPDGARVVTANEDGTAQVWDAATGESVGIPLHHEKIVWDAVFSPDGMHVVTASEDGIARIWDAVTGAPIGVPLGHDQAVWGAAFSSDGASVVTVSADGTARVWDAAPGNLLGVPREEKRIVSAAFSPDGARVVTASDDGTARVWDAAIGNPLGLPLKHERAVHNAAFSPDGLRVVTASDDSTARVWDAATGNPLGLPLKHEQAVRSAVFSPDGLRVVTASEDGTARVWDAATGNPLGLPLKHEQAVRSAVFSPDGLRVVTASDDSTARVWDAATGNPLGLPLKHEQAVRSAVFSPDGLRVVTTSSDGIARVWDAVMGNPVGIPLKHAQSVWSAMFSPDGTHIVTASLDDTARVWDVVTGNPVGAALKHAKLVWSATFSPDGARVVTASEDGTARVWDPETGNQLSCPLPHWNLQSATFSPDGARIVTAGSGARVWQLTYTGTLDAWASRAKTCISPQNDALVLSRVCRLAERPATAADLSARTQALVATGDRDMHAHVWSVPRARYLQALALLDPRDNAIARKDVLVPLRRAISARLAILAVIEENVAQARAQLGPDAPNTDAELLKDLGSIAHNEVREEFLAVALLRRAHDLDPPNPSILVELAQAHFVAGQMDEFARAAAQIDQRRASPNVRVVVAALLWASGRLTHMTTAKDADRLLRMYRELPIGANIGWPWSRIEQALTYGSHCVEDVKLVVKVLAQLQQSITDDTRAKLAALLAAPVPPRRSPQLVETSWSDLRPGREQERYSICE